MEIGIDLHHRPATPRKRVHGKRPAVTEPIEHASVPGEGLEAAAVFPLVQEKPRFGPRQHGGLEPQAVFAEADGAFHLRAEHPLPVPELPGRLDGSPGVPAQSQDTAAEGNPVAEKGEQGFQVRHPGRGVQFDDPRVVVAVEHQAGKPVVLPVHHAVTGGPLRLQMLSRLQGPA